MSGKLSSIALLTVVLVGVVGVGYASAASDYSVRASDTVEVPSRTVTVEGTEYTVTSVGRVAAGDALQAETSGPDGAEFDVNLYNSDRRIVGGESGADGSVSFQTGFLQPGMYTMVVYTSNGSLVSPQPVVVEGYEASLDISGELVSGEPSTATVDVDDIADMGEPESVELVVAQDDSVVKSVTMSQSDTGEYAADIGSSLEAGEYEVYANVRNESTVNGRNEIVGMSDPATVSVAEQQTESNAVAEGESDDPESTTAATETAATDGSNGDSPAADDGSGASNGGDGAEATTQSSDETTETQSSIGEDDSPTQSPVETEQTPETDTESTATTSDSGVITPGTTDADGSGTTTTGTTTPNFAWYIVALALAAAAMVARR